MDTDLERQTEIIFKHHLESILAKDVDGVLQGFAEDAVVFAPDGPIRGREQIRADVNEFLHHLTPKFLRDFKVGRQDIYGEVVYFTWSAGAAFPLAAETFIIRNGKIMVQTFLACTAEGNP